MTLAQWVDLAGVHPRTAYRWFHDGLLPVPAQQLATGTILVDPPGSAPGEVAYARVCAAGPRGGLDRQVARLAHDAAAAGLAPWRVVSEVGWRLNGSRPTWRRLLADADVGTVVAWHRDRLARLGVEYIEVEVGTSVCARLYGRRSARGRAQRAVDAGGRACT